MTVPAPALPPAEPMARPWPSNSGEDMAPLPEENVDTPLLSGQGDIKSDVRLLAFQVGLLDKKLDRLFDEVSKNYATKTEVENLKNDMKKVNDSISWLVKIILGAFVAALLGVVLVKGGMVPR